TADQLRQQRAIGIERLVRRLAGRLADAGRIGLLDILPDPLFPVLRQLAAHAPLELRRQLWMRNFVGIKNVLPLLLRLMTGIDRGPGAVNRRRHFERLVFPAERLARPRNLVDTERGAVASRRALLVGRAPADHGLAADNARPRR